jgi:sigma-B regulation protein RsbU (phosphoserine phosphatase)
MADPMPPGAPTAQSLAEQIFQHAARIGRSTSVAELIRLNADFARELTGADRCSIWLLDRERQELWTMLADGVAPIRITFGQGLVSACVRDEQVLLANDPGSDPRFLQKIDEKSGYTTRQVLCIPMRSDGETIGALQLLNKASGFTAGDAQLVGLLAHFAATAIRGEQLRQMAESARLLSHELDLARDVQARLLPQSLPTPDGLTLAASCRAAHQVGGDYYDLLPLADGSFAFTLGDVSGKGIAAAVTMASIQTLLRTLLQRSAEDLSGVIAEVSNALYDSSSANRYSTLFCGHIDAARRRLTYINAGHISPLVRRDRQLIELPGTGFPMGILPASSFDAQCFELVPGDILLTFSDGIQEVCNRQDEFWPEARPGEILLAGAGTDLVTLLQMLFTEADAWADGAEQHDDMTAVALQIGL